MPVIGSAVEHLVGSAKLEAPSTVIVSNVIPPLKPSSWPPSGAITGNYLNDPLVLDTLSYINAVVPKSLLSIQPSTYLGGNSVKYQADPYGTCYWPFNRCSTPTGTDTEKLVPDITQCPNANQWGLTYDDGPSVDASHYDTEGVRAALKSNNFKATFFLVGSRAVLLPASEIQKTIDEGHEIGTHTWSHMPMTSLTNAQIVAEMKYTESLLYQSIGKVPVLFRPPYGDIDNRVRAIVTALGYKVVMWSVTPGYVRDSFDTSGAGVNATVRNIQSWFVSQPGFISLQHDTNTLTSNIAIQALASIKNSTRFPLSPQPVGQCIGSPNQFIALKSVSVEAPITVLAPPNDNAGDKTSKSNSGDQSKSDALPKGLSGLMMGIVVYYLFF